MYQILKIRKIRDAVSEFTQRSPSTIAQLSFCEVQFLVHHVIANSNLCWKLTGLFSVFPPTTNFFWQISGNRITKRLEYKPESFKFSFILSMTV